MGQFRPHLASSHQKIYLTFDQSLRSICRNPLLIQIINKMSEKHDNKSTSLQNYDPLQYYTVQEELLRKQAYQEFQEVIPNLYIGSQISSLNLNRLVEANIKAVYRVNGITQNLMNYEKHGIDLKVLDLDDMPDFPIEKHFEEANAFIDQYVSNQKSILVICTAGVSRSAALVISYLIKHKRMPYKIAFNTVKRARVFIQPNVGFERALKKYAETYSCELCDMERKTPWFDQYAQKKVGKQMFRVLICDSCECPMIVYIASHKQNLDTEEILEAFNLCEDVGNDYFGVGRWFIEGKQRKIHDHFHWHVRELKMVNDILAIRLLGEEPVIGAPLYAQVDNIDNLKQSSMQLISQHAKTEKFDLIEKRVHRGQAVPNPAKQIWIQSRVRFNFDQIMMIEQTVVSILPQQVQSGQNLTKASMIPNVICQFQYRIKVLTEKDLIKKKQTDQLIGKL